MSDIKSPEETFNQDFLREGFALGVKAVYERLGLDASEHTVNDYLEDDFGKLIANGTDISDFGGKGFSLHHSWFFRWIAWWFLDYLDTINAKNFVVQEIKIVPSVKSGMEGIVIQVWRDESYKQHGVKAIEEVEH